MSKIIAFANHKGGVAKTTTVASVGYCLAKSGYRTLLVDLDPQSNLTSNFLEYQPETSIYDSLCKNQDLPVISISDNLSIVPSSLQHAFTETQLSTTMCRETVLKQRLSKVESSFDFILLDCPPSLGLVTINALASATHLIIPITAEVFPSFGLNMIEQLLQLVKAQLNPSVKINGIVLTRWENNKLSKQIEQLITSSYPGVLFDTKIRKNVAVAAAPLRLQTIFQYDPESNGAKDYKQLSEELLKRIEA